MDAVKFFIGGMTCDSCKQRIERRLRHTRGIREIHVDYLTGYSEISFEGEKISLDDIKNIIKNLGYDFLPDTQSTKIKRLAKNITSILIILALYFLLEHYGILNFLVPGRLADDSMSYGMLFMIGLTASFHCVAMCGGIALSCTAGRNSFTPSALYNLSRVLSYALTGFILGTAGFFVSGTVNSGMSLFIQGVLKLIAGVLVVIMGINMLGIFPALRRLKIPHLTTSNHSQPLITGLLNGLMPCGPLQSVQIIAFASGNPVSGALVMLSFGLGTVPLMSCLGMFASISGRKFSYIGAILVTVMGLAMFSQGSRLSGLIRTDIFASPENNTAYIDGDIQVVNSVLSAGKYPSITVKQGIPVKWTIDAPEKSINGCNYKMIIEDYGLEYSFKKGNNIIEFTPENKGRFQYYCWMGMIQGSILVTD